LAHRLNTPTVLPIGEHSHQFFGLRDAQTGGQTIKTNVMRFTGI